MGEEPNCFQPVFNQSSSTTMNRTTTTTTNSSSNLTTAFWNADPSPFSPSSKLARRLRNRMNIPYYMGSSSSNNNNNNNNNKNNKNNDRDNRSIVGVGFFFRFRN